MGQHHGHHHEHSTERISVAFWLNSAFTIIELIGGFLTNSVAITADAIHDLGDTVSLGMAWYFQKKAQTKPDENYTYGYGRFSLVGALVNSIILLAGSIFMLIQAIPRLLHPEESNVKGMFFLAILGILVNGAAVLKLKKGNSLNERAVSLHLLEDVLGWVAVLIGTILMYFFKWPFIDPLLSIGITAYILFNVYGNLKAVFKVILQAVPEELKADNVQKHLLALDGISNIHDLKLWSIDGHSHVMTLHVVLRKGFDRSQLKKEIRHMLFHENIHHVTIEMEFEGEPCSSEIEHVH